MISGKVGGKGMIGGSISGVGGLFGNIGNKAGSDKTYMHIQAVPAEKWTVQHNLGKRCSVTIVDSADSVVIGDVEYIDNNNVIIRFSAAFGGKCYCN